MYNDKLRERLASEGIEYRETEWTGEGPRGHDTYHGIEVQPGFNPSVLNLILDSVWQDEENGDVDYVDRLEQVIVEADNG